MNESNNINSSSSARVRFAPSPTGALHMGSVRTALFNYLAAKSTNGSFLLRIEDTDQMRLVEDSEQRIYESLNWLGLVWDEGPLKGGPHAPYRQSERLEHYLTAAKELEACGAAYWCDCSKERLEKLKAKQKDTNTLRMYDRKCLTRQEEVKAAIANGASAVLRLKMPTGSVSWNDAVRGVIEFENSKIDDSVLLKADGFPTYHLANVVDDHLMEINHVIRAEEWIPSTPKHLAIYQALNWAAPVFAHVPLVLGPNGKKLSKREGALDILEYKNLGYMPEAICNAMALLGWNTPDENEFFTLKELKKNFTLERIHSNPAIMDEFKLNHINAHHLRKLNDEKLAESIYPWAENFTFEQRLFLAPLLRERIEKFSDVENLLNPLLMQPEIPEDVPFPPTNVSATEAKGVLNHAIKLIEAGSLSDVANFNEELKAYMKGNNLKPKNLWSLFYISLFGATTGLPLYQIMIYLGKDETIKRLRNSLKVLDRGVSTNEISNS